MSSGGRLILASASPRRHALLREAGLEFEIEPADVDESHPGGEPGDVATDLARRKVEEVVSRHRGERLWVLGADTVVGVRGPEGRYTLLGKPADPEEARAMLRSLSDTRHVVATGLWLAASHGEPGEGDVERTWVTMRPLGEAEIEAYVASGEWRDKAGGYAIQETADRFVTRLEGGGFDNVVGLPVARTRDLLDRAGAVDRGGL